MYREGERLIIQPVKGRGLLSTLAGLPTLDEPFADVDARLLPLDDDRATAGIREAEPSDARALLA